MVRVPLLKVFSGFIVVTAIFLVLSWQGYRHAALGSQAIDDVIATGEAQRAYREIVANLTRLQAYAQLVAAGDPAFDAALKEHLAETGAQAMALNEQWSKSKASIRDESSRFMEAWAVAEQAAKDLLALSTHELRLRGDAYNSVLRAQINSLIGIINEIEVKLGSHQSLAADASREWRLRVAKLSFYFSLMTSAAVAVLLLVFISGVWLPAYRVGRLMRRIRQTHPGFDGDEAVVLKALQFFAQHGGSDKPQTPLIEDQTGFFQNLDSA